MKRQIEHVLATVRHFSKVKGGQNAGAVTYFGFLSVFPVLALAFFAVGYVARVYPDAQEALLEAIDQVLPGLVGDGADEVPLSDVQDAAGAAGLIGLLGILYAGLGWLSALRDALVAVFEVPASEQPGFVIGKLRDLASLFLLGVVLILSVAVSGVVTRFSGELLDWAGFGAELGWLLAILAVLLGLAAGVVLFFAMFRLLARPELPSRALWGGALLGAVGFEILKQLSGLLLTITQGQPAFQVFGIALILLVWINYFSRVVLYAAAWAFTSVPANPHTSAPEPAHFGPRTRTVRPSNPQPPAYDVPGRSPVNPVTSFAAGAATTLAVVALLRRGRRN